jgi:DNA invertase Pin-like site-specific DNA recombinase
MKKSIMRATLPTPPGQTLVKQLDLLRKCGFDGIQLGVQGMGELTLRTPDADVTALAKACRDAGVEPHSIYGGITFFREDEADRKRGQDEAKHVLEIAALLGTKTILIHPGQLTSAIPYDDCWKYALEGLLALKEKAESTHLRLGLENVWKKFLTVSSPGTTTTPAGGQPPQPRTWRPFVRRAIAYHRCSTKGQEDGRSLARQEEAVKAYCGRHALALDKKTYIDVGVSAYHGANATHGELGQFLDRLMEGYIPKGVTLVVENLDRLTRNTDPHKANGLIIGIVEAGLDIAVVSPEQLYTQATILKPETWVVLQLFLALNAEESRKKSERVCDAWAAKRDTAATVKISKRGPFWLRLTADRAGWTVIEAKARWVRRMFELAAEGFGVGRIAKVLNAEHPPGLSGRGWQPGAIAGILRSRAAIGEFQPHTGTCARKGRPKTRKPAGEPLRGYFPAVVPEADFYRVQTAIDGRKRTGGPARRVPNIFNGILWDGADGRRMVVNGQHGRRHLVSGGAVQRLAGSVYASVRYDAFERSILGALAELTTADVLGKPNQAQERLTLLTGRLTTVNRKLDSVRTRAAEEDDVTVFLDLLADLDRQRKHILVDLEKAHLDAKADAAGNLGEFRSLVALMAECPPEELEGLRRKVQAALRRVVREIWAVIVPTGNDRLVGVRAYLESGRERDYLLHVRRDGRCRTRSMLTTETPMYVAADLRNLDEASSLAGYLASLSAENIELVFRGCPVA